MPMPEIVVDDEPPLVEFLTELLREGYRVRRFRSSPSAPFAEHHP